MRPACAAAGRPCAMSSTALAAAHAAHDDPPMAIAEMAASVRRWIEEHTFVPDSGSTGVQFVDDQAARYGEFDEIAARRSHRGRVARPAEAEHFLSGFAAGVARLAHGEGSSRGRRGAVPRAAAVALRARDGFDRQPGRRSARGAFHVHRRDPAGEARGREMADSFPTSFQAERDTTRWIRTLGNGPRCAPPGRRGTRMHFTALSAHGDRSVRRPGRSARSRRISVVRSSSSRSTSSGWRKSPRTKRSWIRARKGSSCTRCSRLSSGAGSRTGTRRSRRTRSTPPARCFARSSRNSREVV